MNVTIIGVGALGGALAEGILAEPSPGTSRSFANGPSPPERDPVALTLCVRQGTSSPIARSFTTRVVSEPAEAVADADLVVVAVKPRATPALVAAVSSSVPAGALLVSCAAGVSLDRLAAAAQGRCALARAMPNVGARRGASTTAVLLGPNSEESRDLPRLHRVFSAVGHVREVLDESLLHVVTAVAASGPAFLLLALEALVDGAVEAGMPRADALVWARGALQATAACLDDGTEPQALRSQVTSPAGTTAAGLAQLEERGVRAAFQASVRAATARSRELA